jgi:hypothetical protein
VRIVRRLAAACAVVALLLAVVAGDSQGACAGDDGDGDVAVACDLTAVLPPAPGEAPPALSLCGAVFVDACAPSGHAPELEIFRPPRTRA